MKYYTGIGSRETPDNVLVGMRLIAQSKAYKGYTLRSGGAYGADTAFEEGCDEYEGDKEIYLPWRNFNGNKSELYLQEFPVELQGAAYHLARQLHPAWDRLSEGAKKMHTRNVFQVLGQDLNTPSELVICWTPRGKVVGGTATAINLARSRGIEVVNLAVSEYVVA